MAINIMEKQNNKPLEKVSSNDLSEHYFLYKRQLTLKVMLFSIVTAFVILGCVIYIIKAENVALIDQVLISITATIIFISLLILVNNIVKPYLAVLETLIFLSKPNPNVKPPLVSKQKNGLNNVLNFIYQINAKENGTIYIDKPKSIIETGLCQSKFGLIIYDKNQKIIFTNEYARKFINFDQQLSFDLNQDININEWIRQSSLNKINNHKTWNKIKFTENNEKKFYDIEASFQKSSNAETVVLITDKTNLYTPEEEDFEFIAFAAHELRGPITIIRGYLDVLENDLPKDYLEKNQEFVNRLKVAANRLNNYVNNILSANKFDNSHLNLYLHEEKVSDIFDSIRDDALLRAKTQYRMINFKFDDSLPSVAADKASIGEVMTNLIDNAIKYSSEGSVINISAYQQGDYVNFEVEDHGIGMPSSVVNNLFKKFYRSHRSKESVSGTGIGLYISKAIIDSHGGYIEVKSNVGEGSTFTFGLPIYSSVAENIRKSQGQNTNLIKHETGGWIANHGVIKK